MSYAKEFLAGLIVAASLVTNIINKSPARIIPVQEYVRTGIVYAVEYADDTIVVETLDGELWAFYGCEDWECGDICELTFMDAGILNYIWDDEITNVCYLGRRATP